MGNATITKPHQGFQDPRLAQVFAPRVSSNKTTPVITLPANDHSQSRLPVGAIAGGIVGSFVVILLLAEFFRRRRRRMAVPPQPPQELQGCGIYELHDWGNIFELPSSPIELNDSASAKTL